MGSKKRIKSLLKWILLLYAVALTASHIVRWNGPDTYPYLEGQQLDEVQEMKGSKALESTVSLAFLDSPSVDPDAPVLVLLHGSPVASSSLQNISAALEGPFRVIVPDLPGFGGSTLEIEDYSVLAHAYYLDQLMVQLEVDSFHLIGYSMGGGVAIDYVHAFPEKVKSLQLVSSIGVQELELLGDYLINHAIHGGPTGRALVATRVGSPLRLDGQCHSQCFLCAELLRFRSTSLPSLPGGVGSSHADSPC